MNKMMAGEALPCSPTEERRLKPPLGKRLSLQRQLAEPRL
jgi:hypothetical protein